MPLPSIFSPKSRMVSITSRDVSLPGINFFAAAVILTMIATAWLENIVSSVAQENKKRASEKAASDSALYGEDASK